MRARRTVLCMHRSKKQEISAVEGVGYFIAEPLNLVLKKKRQTAIIWIGRVKFRPSPSFSLFDLIFEIPLSLV